MKIVANIVYKSVLQPIKDIEERNKRFDELTDEGKRLEIAWDCLQLVVKGSIKANDLSEYWSKELEKIKPKTSKELQKLLIKELPKGCSVCARGGLMLSQIRLGNKISPFDGAKHCGVTENIRGFNFLAFREIEREYESNQYNHPYSNNTEQKLANIMCNILVNGDFNIYDRTNYLTVTNY